LGSGGRGHALQALDVDEIDGGVGPLSGADHGVVLLETGVADEPLREEDHRLAPAHRAQGVEDAGQSRERRPVGHDRVLIDVLRAVADLVVGHELLAAAGVGEPVLSADGIPFRGTRAAADVRLEPPAHLLEREGVTVLPDAHGLPVRDAIGGLGGRGPALEPLEHVAQLLHVLGRPRHPPGASARAHDRHRVAFTRSEAEEVGDGLLRPLRAHGSQMHLVEHDHEGPRRHPLEAGVDGHARPELGRLDLRRLRGDVHRLEGADLLRHSVFAHLEIFRTEPGQGPTPFRGHHDVDHDQLDVRRETG
jgi:hypothetical protein